MGNYVIVTSRLHELHEHTDCSPYSRVSTVTNVDQNVIRRRTKISLAVELLKLDFSQAPFSI